MKSLRQAEESMEHVTNWEKILPEQLFFEVVKRDGRQVLFQREKITEAMRKSFIAIDGTADVAYCDQLAQRVVAECTSRFTSNPTVEQIQDVVEEMLISQNHAQVAKAYILYRAERNRAREIKTRLMQIYEDITFNDSRDSDTKRENANVNGDTAMGTMLKYGSEGAKQFFQMFVLKPEHAQAHGDGDIHIHDLDFLTTTTTCCQIDLIRLFEGGFGTGHGALREPSNIASYSALTCIAIQSNQNDQHGGQSIPNFDYALARGVRKSYARRYRENLVKFFEITDALVAPDDVLNVQSQLQREGQEARLAENKEHALEERSRLEKLGLEPSLIQRAQAYARKQAEKETDRDTFQAMEALIHNLNTMHSRAGAQTPFSSINYGTDCTAEGRMVIKNVLKALDEGLGDGETPIFPIHIFRVKEGVNFNPDDVNYDLFQQACRVSAKRLFPNFSFQDAPFNMAYYKEGHPETEIAYMGCRTRVIGNVHDRDREITYGRGNLSFTSVNLPRIALKSQGNIGRFFNTLDKKIDLCVEQLMERFQIQCAKKVKNFPFLMGQGIWIDSENLSSEDTVGDVLKHGTLSIGFIGLAECLKALIGEHHGESEEAQKLGLRIIARMRARMDEESQKRGLNFTLIATPAEGLAGRFVKLDRKKFGVHEGVTERDYYTNSFHIPVYHPLSAAEKIRLEAPYHALTNAGHITYVELDGDTVHNPIAFEKIIRFMKESGIGYGSVNHPVDRDPVCGYSGVIGKTCPKCGREEGDIPFDRIRRITGYLVGTLDRFNNAKKREVEQRVRHGMSAIQK